MRARECSQGTARPTSVPAAAPTSTSVGKWRPAAMRSRPTLVPTATVTTHGHQVPPWRRVQVMLMAVSAAKVVEVWPE